MRKLILTIVLSLVAMGTVAAPAEAVTVQVCAYYGGSWGFLCAYNGEPTTPECDVYVGDNGVACVRVSTGGDAA